VKKTWFRSAYRRETSRYERTEVAPIRATKTAVAANGAGLHWMEKVS
jgi:hypothetical protein